MRKQYVLASAAAVTIFGLSSVSHAESIGIDYRDSQESTALASTAVAGVAPYAQDNWNSTTPNEQAAPSNLPQALLNDSGLSSGASLTAWSETTGNSWHMSDPNVGTNSNALMMEALSDTGPSLTVSNLDSNFTTNGYTVVVYYESNNTFLDTVSVTGATSLSVTPTTSDFSTAGFVQGTSLNSATQTNYAVFTGLTAANVTISLSPATTRNNGIAAVQLISNAPASVPEPASLSLLGIGTAGLLARRRRKA